PFALSPCWQRPEDPCANTVVSASLSQRAFGTSGTTTDKQFDFIPRAELQAVDVFIRYKETQTDSRSAQARGGCGGAAGCEYTRVQEGCEIYCLPANDCEVAPDPWIEWETAYGDALRKVRGDLARILQL